MGLIYRQENHMTRIFTDAAHILDGCIYIDGAQLNHIKNVLRMRPGEQLSVSDGLGHVFLCVLESYQTEEAVLRIREEQRTNELRSRLVLFQGLPKGDKLELIIQKAVELGAADIVPVRMKRCIVKWDEKKAENRLKRYRAIAESAAEQSQRDIVPEVSDCLSFDEALIMAGTLDHILVPYERAEGIEESRRILKSIRPGESAGIFIGPEGGFEEEEVRKILDAGGKALTLGRRILRTETAGLTVLSILMFELEE